MGTEEASIADIERSEHLSVKDWVVGVALLGTAFLAAWWMIVYGLGPAAVRAGDVVRRLGWNGAFKHYNDAFLKNVNEMGPVGWLFWGIVITYGLISWNIGSAIERHEKESFARIKALSDEIKGVNENVEQLKRTIESLIWSHES